MWDWILYVCFWQFGSDFRQPRVVYADDQECVNILMLIPAVFLIFVVISCYITLTTVKEENKNNKNKNYKPLINQDRSNVQSNLTDLNRKSRRINSRLAGRIGNAGEVPISSDAGHVCGGDKKTSPLSRTPTVVSGPYDTGASATSVHDVSGQSSTQNFGTIHGSSNSLNLREQTTSTNSPNLKKKTVLLSSDEIKPKVLKDAEQIAPAVSSSTQKPRLAASSSNENLKLVTPSSTETPKVAVSISSEKPKLAVPLCSEKPKQAAPQNFEKPKQAAPQNFEKPKQAAPQNFEKPKQAAPCSEPNKQSVSSDNKTLENNKECDKSTPSICASILLHGPPAGEIHEGVQLNQPSTQSKSTAPCSTTVENVLSDDNRQNVIGENVNVVETVILCEVADESKAFSCDFPSCKIDLRGMRLDYAMIYLYTFLTSKYEAYITSKCDRNLRYIYIVTGYKGRNDELSVIKHKVEKHLIRVGYKDSHMWLGPGEVRVDLSSKGEVQQDEFSDSDVEEKKSFKAKWGTTVPDVLENCVYKTLDLRDKTIQAARNCLKHFLQGISTNDVHLLKVFIDPGKENDNLKQMVENYLNSSGFAAKYSLIQQKSTGKEERNIKSIGLPVVQKTRVQTRPRSFLPNNGEYFREPDDKKIDIRSMRVKKGVETALNFISKMYTYYRQTLLEKDRYIFIVTGFGRKYGNDKIKKGIAGHLKANNLANKYIWIKAGMLMFDLKDEIPAEIIDAMKEKTRRFDYIKDSEPPEKKLSLMGQKKVPAMEIFVKFLQDQLQIYKETREEGDRYIYVVTGFRGSDPVIGPVIKPAVQDYLDTNGFKTRHKFFNRGGLVMIDLEESDDIEELSVDDDTDGDEIYDETSSSDDLY